MLFQHNPVVRHYPRQNLNRQQGVVIVVALFIVALVATMAYVMLARLERDINRTNLILHDTQAEFYAQGSLAWAIDTLRNNWDTQKQNQPVDNLPLKSPVNDEHGYKISSTIYDMQARFNLNNLAKVDAQASFKRLMQALSPDLSDAKASDIMRNVMDWITPGVAQNEQSKFYLEQPVPYRSAHRPMQSISELRLIKGMTPVLFAALAPYVTALPAATLINVQSAEAPVLMTLSPTLTLDAAKEIENVRAQKPLATTQNFLDLDIVKNHHIAAEKITLVSSYFLVETDVTIEKQQVVLYTLLERTTQENKSVVTILWQSIGTW